MNTKKLKLERAFICKTIGVHETYGGYFYLVFANTSKSAKNILRNFNKGNHEGELYDIKILSEVFTKKKKRDVQFLGGHSE